MISVRNSDYNNDDNSKIIYNNCNYKENCNLHTSKSSEAPQCSFSRSIPVGDDQDRCYHQRCTLRSASNHTAPTASMHTESNNTNSSTTSQHSGSRTSSTFRNYRRSGLTRASANSKGDDEHDVEASSRRASRTPSNVTPTTANSTSTATTNFVPPTLRRKGAITSPRRNMSPTRLVSNKVELKNPPTRTHMMNPLSRLRSTSRSRHQRDAVSEQQQHQQQALSQRQSDRSRQSSSPQRRISGPTDMDAPRNLSQRQSDRSKQSSSPQRRISAATDTDRPRNLSLRQSDRSKQSSSPQRRISSEAIDTDVPRNRSQSAQRRRQEQANAKDRDKNKQQNGFAEIFVPKSKSSNRNESIPNSVFSSAAAGASPESCLDTLLLTRGYSTKKYHALESGYYNEPTPYQEASYHQHILQLVVNDDIPSLRSLFKFGLSNNPSNYFGDSLAHYASRLGKYHVLKLMIQEYGCDIRVANASGSTPLHEACRREKPCFELIDLIARYDILQFRMLDGSGDSPLACVPQHRWTQYSDFINHNKDLLWPFGEEQKNVPPIVKMKPNTRTIPNPSRAVPPDVLLQLSSGKIKPVEIPGIMKMRKQKRRDSGYTDSVEHYTSDREDETIDTREIISLSEDQRHGRKLHKPIRISGLQIVHEASRSQTEQQSVHEDQPEKQQVYDEKPKAVEMQFGEEVVVNNDSTQVKRYMLGNRDDDDDDDDNFNSNHESFDKGKQHRIVPTTKKPMDFDNYVQLDEEEQEQSADAAENFYEPVKKSTKGTDNIPTKSKKGTDNIQVSTQGKAVKRLSNDESLFKKMDRIQSIILDVPSRATPSREKNSAKNSGKNESKEGNRNITTHEAQMSTSEPIQAQKEPQLPSSNEQSAHMDSIQHSSSRVEAAQAPAPTSLRRRTSGVSFANDTADESQNVATRRMNRFTSINTNRPVVAGNDEEINDRKEGEMPLFITMTRIKSKARRYSAECDEEEVDDLHFSGSDNVDDDSISTISASPISKNMKRAVVIPTPMRNSLQVQQRKAHEHDDNDDEEEGANYQSMLGQSNRVSLSSH